MTKDRQGHALSGATPEAAALYERAVEAFNVYHGDPMTLLAQAIEAAPRFAMAHLLRAQLLGLATEPDAADQARATIGEIRNLALDEREARHLAALEYMVAGDWTLAAVTLDRLSLHFPHDLIALQVGHQTDFFRANARNLRDRIARALPSWSTDMPGYSFLLGMLAFGQEETGDYLRAEETGRRALDLQPLDCWAHHAVAHVMEMQGRAQDGIGWMVAREPYWADDACFFKVHNWWHRALYHLDLGQRDEVMALYDGPIRKDKSVVALDMVDASALLWRLHLAGHDVGNRWVELAAAWDAHADGKTYPFNDWHAVMSYLGAGRPKDVARLAKAFSESDRAVSESAGWGRATALPLIQGFSAFWKGDYRNAVELLHPVRFIANAFGGSHAQRDVIDWTLTEAALRGNMRDAAAAIAHERLSLKPHSPINRAFLARARDADSAQTPTA